MEITINQEQRLFVIKAGEGFSCHGFDVVYGHCMELAKRIKRQGILKVGQKLVPILESEKGTPQQYQDYQDLLSMVRGRKLGTWFNYDTPSALRMVLENYRKNGGAIRIFYGDTKTGRSWMEENDVIGEVGRSGGDLQIPLLISPGEFGGGAILDSCIVRIIDADNRRELYRHSLFHVPEMEIRNVSQELRQQGYTHGVWVRNQKGEFENSANFTSYGKSAKWVAFMTGDCVDQP